MAWPGGKAWFSGLDIAFEFSPTSAWNATPTWVDITANLRDISFTYGRSSSILSQPTAGRMTATLVDNTRTFDPSYASSPYTGGGLDPRRMIRLRARYASVEYTLGTWFVNGWRQISEPSNHLTFAQVTATDGFLPLAQAVVPIGTGDPFEGAGERVDQRIGRLLDFAGWPAAARTLDTDCPVVGRFDRTVEHNVLTTIQTAAASDFGIFYIGPDGNAVYRGHRWQAGHNLTALATLGDGGGSELGYLPFDRDRDDSQLVNHVKGSCETPLAPRWFYGDLNATLSVVETVDITDTASHDQYGEALKDLGQVDIWNGNVLENTCEWVLAQFAQPVVRAQQVSLLPLGSPAAQLPVVLAAGMGTRFTLNRRPNNVGSVASVDCIVEGGGMSLSVGGLLKVDYWLSQAPTGYWILGTSKLGAGGTAIWA